jgi:hypothetical protein
MDSLIPLVGSIKSSNALPLIEQALARIDCKEKKSSIPTLNSTLPTLPKAPLHC